MTAPATARVNGTSEPSSNGEEKEQKDKNDNKTEPIKPKETGKQVPTTNMKCLEDPTFSFDEPKPSSVSVKPIPSVDNTATPSDSKPAESAAGPPKNLPIEFLKIQSWTFLSLKDHLTRF